MKMPLRFQASAKWRNFPHLLKKFQPLIFSLYSPPFIFIFIFNYHPYQPSTVSQSTNTGKQSHYASPSSLTFSLRIVIVHLIKPRNWLNPLTLFFVPNNPNPKSRIWFLFHEKIKPIIWNEIEQPSPKIRIKHQPCDELVFFEFKICVLWI